MTIHPHRGLPMSEDAKTVVSVLGLGAMGHGIVQAFASRGYHVHGFDASPKARNDLLERVHNNLNQFTRAGLFRDDKVAPAWARIPVHGSLEAGCRPATFVVEAIREDLAVKQALFEE